MHEKEDCPPPALCWWNARLPTTSDQRNSSRSSGRGDFHRHSAETETSRGVIRPRQCAGGVERFLLGRSLLKHCLVVVKPETTDARSVGFSPTCQTRNCPPPALCRWKARLKTTCAPVNTGRSSGAGKFKRHPAETERSCGVIQPIPPAEPTMQHFPCRSSDQPTVLFLAFIEDAPQSVRRILTFVDSEPPLRILTRGDYGECEC